MHFQILHSSPRTDKTNNSEARSACQLDDSSRRRGRARRVPDRRCVGRRRVVCPHRRRPSTQYTHFTALSIPSPHLNHTRSPSWRQVRLTDFTDAHPVNAPLALRESRRCSNRPELPSFALARTRVVCMHSPNSPRSTGRRLAWSAGLVHLLLT